MLGQISEQTEMFLFSACLGFKQNTSNRKGTICLNPHPYSNKETTKVGFTGDSYQSTTREACDHQTYT